jgi:CBS domain-containing protein
MTVGRICQREVDVAEPYESARAAAQRMATRCVGTLLVLDDRRRPVGILTDRDLALRVVAEGKDAGTTTVAEAMTPRPHTVEQGTPIEDALALMRAKAVRRLPVVSAAGELIGVVTLDDVLALLAEEMWQMGRLIQRSSPQVLAQS